MNICVEWFILMHSLDELVPGKNEKLQNKTALPVRAIICADVACLYFWCSFIKEFPHCCLRLPLWFHSRKCSFETSLWLLSEQKLMTYFKSSLYHVNQLCNHPGGQSAIDPFTLFGKTSFNNSFWLRGQICQLWSFFFKEKKRRNMLKVWLIWCHEPALKLMAAVWAFGVVWLRLTRQATFLPLEDYSARIDQLRLPLAYP